MPKNSLYQYNPLCNNRLYIHDLCQFLEQDKSNVHFIKGALVCFCRNGQATIKINYKTHLLTRNSAIVILPTHMFEIQEHSEEFEAEAVLYSENYWTDIAQAINYKLFKVVEQAPSVLLSDDKCAEAFHLLDLIHAHEDSAYSVQPTNNIELSLVGGLAYSLLMLVCLAIDDANTDLPQLVSRKEILTRDFFDLLSQHFNTERQVAFYASKLCVTPKHLSTMVKDVTKLPILDWITNVTILNIKHRLRTGQDTIQQISEELNFPTPSSFVRYFRLHTGTTPLKYRNSVPEH